MGAFDYVDLKSLPPAELVGNGGYAGLLRFAKKNQTCLKGFLDKRKPFNYLQGALTGNSLF
jgi:hypothetical protein